MTGSGDRRGPASRAFKTPEKLRTAFVDDVAGNCTQFVPVAKEGYRDYVFRVRCRNCPACLRAHRYQWALRAEYETMFHPSSWFFTGTFREQWHELDRAAESVTLFLKRLRYYTTEEGINFRYLMLPERHKSGAWHYHGLIHHEGTVSYRDIGKAWQDGYWTAKVVQGTGLKAARYVTKYATKDLLSEDGNRRPRVRASRNPTYGGPMVIRDLETVREIMESREVEAINKTWDKNLKQLLRESREPERRTAAMMERDLLEMLHMKPEERSQSTVN